MNAVDQAAETARTEANKDTTEVLQLAQYIRARMTDMRNFRNAEGISERLLGALRTYKGQYDPARLSEIKQFNGSEVYARVTSTKCRAATALLRDVYLGPDRPWDVAPTPHPEVPENVDRTIQDLVQMEIATAQAGGQQIDPQAVNDRVAQLRKSAARAAKKVAYDEADIAVERLDDILTEGAFYEAFAEFLIDLPIFPFAALKGPTVRNVQQTKWVYGNPVQQRIPKMFWSRVSPFDLYWSPGAGKVQHADFVERIRLSRAELQQLRGVPGYNDAAIEQVLSRFYNNGFHDWWDTIDAERADLEDRERWSRTTTTLVDCAEFTGYVSGRLLREWGMAEEKVPEATQEYFVTAWMIDRFVIKVQINPYVSQRAPYYISSFEKVPGALIGYGLPDLLEDVQQICNAAARSLVNNMGISSGPQVVINDEVMQPGENDQLYPWKRWHVNYSMYNNSAAEPVKFTQPESNAQDLIGVYERWSMMGDEISAIPKYMTGNEKVGGAGRTASGLAMLMGNASKTLQNVAASIDNDVIKPLLTQLYDMLMLTQPGMFRGDELIVVKGVNHAIKREQDRMRQLEFLQLTANPIDMSVIGPVGRANILRSIANNLGLEAEKTVPDNEEVQMQFAAAQAQAAAGPDGAKQPDNRTPKPQPQRAGPEEARRPVEKEFTGPTGRPGMRAGG
jgi:hypothetical protein